MFTNDADITHIWAACLIFHWTESRIHPNNQGFYVTGIMHFVYTNNNNPKDLIGVS